MRRTLSICLPLATFAVIAAAWQMLATYGGFPPKLVPGLGKIAEAFVRLAGDGTLLAGMVRALEQFAKLVPRMLCALLAAGFVAKLIPSALIAAHLGASAGLRSILIAAAAGLIVPAGPAIAFSIAVVFVRSGASVPA